MESVEMKKSPRIIQAREIINTMDNIRRMFSAYRVDNNLSSRGMYFDSEDKIYEAIDLMKDELEALNNGYGGC